MIPTHAYAHLRAKQHVFSAIRSALKSTFYFNRVFLPCVFILVPVIGSPADYIISNLDDDFGVFSLSHITLLLYTHVVTGFIFALIYRFVQLFFVQAAAKSITVVEFAASLSSAAPPLMYHLAHFRVHQESAV